jgi:predicted DNA-binding protein (MmcQ/YjbR family)
MTLKEIRKYCLSKNGAFEDYPFDEGTIVMKVGSKMFALMNKYENPIAVNLKCEPFLAMNLRDRFSAVTPGYHMNKLHWNTVVADGSIPESEIRKMIDHSYELVFNKLKKSEREEIQVNAEKKRRT